VNWLCRLGLHWWMPGERLGRQEVSAMRNVVTIVTGSRAYGTAIPGSDTDLKAVHVPSADDVLLQRIAPSVKAGTGDHESYALHRFLEMAAEGQPIAIEMLFTPPSMTAGEPDPLWLEIVAGRDRLLTSKTAFSGYSRRQAGSYGGKAIRFGALRAVQDVMAEAAARHGDGARLEVAAAALDTLGEPGVAVIDREGGSGRTLVVGERQIPLGVTLAKARPVVDALVARYGARVLRATHGGGIDWKALMHAVRLAGEGAEYHATGTIRLPRPDAARLREIRLGLLPLAEVEDLLASASERLSAAATRSARPAEPDRAWIEDLVLRAYGAAVLTELAPRREPMAPPGP
jgi:hypothetical protein